MTKKDREVLRQAGIIIRDELKNGRVVRIPDLGKFYFGTVTCHERLPVPSEIAEIEGSLGDNQTFIQTVPRFRAFRELKAIVRQRKYLD